MHDSYNSNSLKFPYGSLRAQPLLDSLCVSLQPLGVDPDGLTVLSDYPLRHGAGIVLEELLHLLSFLLCHKSCCSNLKGRGGGSGLSNLPLLDSYLKHSRNPSQFSPPRLVWLWQFMAKSPVLIKTKLKRVLVRQTFSN